MAAAWTNQAFRLINLTKRVSTALPLNTSSFSRRDFSVLAKEQVQTSELPEKGEKNDSIKNSFSQEALHPLKHHDYFDVRRLVTLEALFKNKVHFGHHSGTREAYMTPYIFGTRFDNDIIDLEKTLPLFQDALNFVAHIAYRNGIILFVSKNRIVMPKVEQMARQIGEYAHCRHWHQGLFTDTANLLKYVTRLPDVCIFLNTLDNVFELHPCVNDSAKLLIPSVGIVDTNCDPRLISYPIPGNDDSVQTQLYYLNLFREAILIGKKRRREDGLVLDDKEITEFPEDTEEMNAIIEDLEINNESVEKDTNDVLNAVNLEKHTEVNEIIEEVTDVFDYVKGEKHENLNSEFAEVQTELDDEKK